MGLIDVRIKKSVVDCVMRILLWLVVFLVCSWFITWLVRVLVLRLLGRAKPVIGLGLFMGSF